MTPAEHREYVQAAWREATPTLLESYFEKLASNGADIDDLRKAVELAARATGTDAEKKVDANAGLAVFQFTFLNGQMTATPVGEAPKDIEAEAKIVEVPWPFGGEGPAEKPKELAMPPAPEAAIDDDVMAQLDDMLGID